MGFLEFSWATISLMDIGVLSISVIGLWWLKNRVDGYRTLSEELDKRYNARQQEHTTLQQEFKNFQSPADRRYNALRQESEVRYNTLQEGYNVLKAENGTLRSGLEAITKEHKALERTCDTMAGRYQEISDKFTLILEKLANKN